MIVLAVRFLCAWLAIACGWPKWVYTQSNPVVRARQKNALICKSLSQFGGLPSDLAAEIEDDEDVLTTGKHLQFVVMVCGDSKYKNSPSLLNDELQKTAYSSNPAPSYARKIHMEIGGDVGYIDPCHDVQNSGDIAMKSQKKKKKRHKFTMRVCKNVRRPKGLGILRDVRKERRLKKLVIKRSTTNRYMTHSQEMWEPFYTHHGSIVVICIRAEHKEVCHVRTLRKH